MRHLVSLSFVTILLLSTALNGHLANAQPNEPENTAVENLNDSVEELGAQDQSDTQAKRATTSSNLKVTRITPEQEDDQTNGDLYLRQIRRIESQVNELKEEIFRSRTRLAILKESVLASGLAGTELRIIHRNEMGANFKLERILYILDGSPISQRVDTNGELDQQEEIEIINGNIKPGPHELQVELIYRGNGFGVFSYLQSYRFTINEVRQFRAEEGKRLTIAAVGYERSNLLLELKDRPAIRFDMDNVSLDDVEDSSSKKRVP